jgi:hypothetical protein
MIEEEEAAVILVVADSGMVNVSGTVMVIEIVGMTAGMAMVIVEDSEEIEMATETGIGFPTGVVAIETGILEAEVVLVHVGPMDLDPSMREKVEDLEEEMMDLLQKEVLTNAHYILCFYRKNFGINPIREE